MSKASNHHELRILFPSAESKLIFAEWLADGGGEQDYFRAMEDSATPSLLFGYHGPENEEFPRDDRRRYGDFLCDNTIRIEVCEDDG